MKQNKKLLAIVVSVTLVLGLVIGGSMAFLNDSTQEVTNTFTPSAVTTAVVEDFTDNVKKDVRIQNTGNTEAFIRAAIVINWADGDGNVYGAAPVAGTDYSITFATDDSDGKDGKWVKNGGYYYWTKPVAAEDSTGILIESVELVTSEAAPNGNAPEGYALSVEILCSGVQSKPAAAVEAWSNGLYTVANVGTADAVLKAK